MNLWGIWAGDIKLHELPKKDQELFIKKLVERYGIGSVYFISNFMVCFPNEYEWAVFTKENYENMTPKAKKFYEIGYRDEIMNIINRGSSLKKGITKK